MALSGTLETFSLPEVLRLLASTKKTGLLSLHGDRGSGWLWVDDGDLLAAGADRSVVDELEAVVFELLRFADASFEFDATAPAPASGERRGVEAALEVASRRLEEWRDIEAVVPSLDVRVRMTGEIETEVTVTAGAWRVLACVGAGASGHDVARRLSQGEYEVCSALRDLAERHLVEVELDVEERAPEPVAVTVVAELPAEVGEPRSELSLLSPRAAAAVEATWTDRPSDVHDDEAAVQDAPPVAAGPGVGDDLDQNILLRFLSSAKP